MLVVAVPSGIMFMGCLSVRFLCVSNSNSFVLCSNSVMLSCFMKDCNLQCFRIIVNHKAETKACCLWVRLRKWWWKSSSHSCETDRRASLISSAHVCCVDDEKVAHKAARVRKPPCPAAFLCTHYWKGWGCSECCRPEVCHQFETISRAAVLAKHLICVTCELRLPVSCAVFV